MVEVWKGMIYNGVDYSDRFKVSNLGRIYSCSRNKIIRICVCQCGYYRWVTRINKKPINFGVHRAVACTFIPNPDNLPQVNHKDGNKLNNSINNLEWVTNRDNTIHAVEHKLLNTRGEDNHNSKLTETDVRYIRLNYIPYNKVYGANALAKRFGVSKTTILRILQNKLWKHVK